MSETIRCAAVVPIPVGHRVDVRFFQHDVGVFRAKLEVHRDAPLVVDLDTGITYGAAEHFERYATYQSGTVREVPLTLLDDLVEVERWQGRVTHVQIVWIGDGDSRYPQTTLVVERDSGAAFR